MKRSTARLIGSGVVIAVIVILLVIKGSAFKNPKQISTPTPSLNVGTQPIIFGYSIYQLDARGISPSDCAGPLRIRLAIPGQIADKIVGDYSDGTDLIIEPSSTAMDIDVSLVCSSNQKGLGWRLKSVSNNFTDIYFSLDGSGLNLIPPTSKVGGGAATPTPTVNGTLI